MVRQSFIHTLLALAAVVAAQASGDASEIETIRTRRASAIIASVKASQVGSWLGSLDAEGKWPDVNYASGCDAQRANWPAGGHWSRIQTMAAAYSGGVSAASDAEWRDNAGLYQAISRAIDWWFARDFTNYDCLDNGNVDGSTCTCGTPGLWNTNWFSNVILIPEFVSQTCLLLSDTLTESQASSCSHITTRAYSPFLRANPPGFVSGANILDMAKIGIDEALRVSNVTLLAEAFGRIHNEMVVEPSIAVVADGIKPDGSFGQHLGLSYAGNYGKDFINAVMALEEAALGTSFSANEASRTAIAILMEGNRWAVFRNLVTGVAHWDFSVLSRFISFPVADSQATAELNLNLTQIAHVGQEWGSDQLIQFASSLQGDTSSSNAGGVLGNRMFWSNDYMVHRSENYVSTLKMYSSRTLNTEFTNNQNPYGFHLSDGTLYTYLRGDEYEDIAAAWDWNLIPGTTTDYGNYPLSGSTSKTKGVENFVGGASTGYIGVSAFRYTNPKNKGFSFQKAYFFLDDDVQHIMVNNIRSNSSAPVFSVLDQKRRNGPIYINEGYATGNSTNPVQTLWHDNVGYTFDNLAVSIKAGNQTGTWSTIGTSTQPPTNVNLFSAWIDHTDISVPVAYTAFPATTYDDFLAKREESLVRTIQNDAYISAVQDDCFGVVAAVFWDKTGGSFTVDGTTITSSAAAIVIYQAQDNTITVSDPSQTLSQLQVTIALAADERPASWWGAESKTLTFDLPAGPGGMAGSSVIQSIA